MTLQFRPQTKPCGSLLGCASSSSAAWPAGNTSGGIDQRLALLFAGLAVVLGCGGLVWPRGIRPVFMTAMALTMPIGWVVSRLLLGVLFFGLFTPVGFVFKLIGRDALARRYTPERASYWEPKRGAADIRSYLRQS